VIIRVVAKEDKYMWRNHFCQLLSKHEANNDRHTDIHTASQ